MNSIHVGALSILLLSHLAQASDGGKKFSPDTIPSIMQTNQRPVRRLLEAEWPVTRPYSEIEKTGYVAISGSYELQARELPDLRLAIAKNLPSDVMLVVYVMGANEIPRLQADLGPDLGHRLKFLVVPPSYNVIWARDSLPFPVYLSNDAGETALGLVDSIYSQSSFEPDEAIARALSARRIQTGFKFRGGNLLFDLEGNCFAERASEVKAMLDPETSLKKYFGCKTVTILPHDGGIGDIDERVKFLEGKHVITDSAIYKPEFERLGYRVTMFPTTGEYYETYMNTLLVNDVMFVPQMGIPADQEALKAYEALGYQAVGVHTKLLADYQLGNIHCVTMNYPVGTFEIDPLAPQMLRFRR